MWPLAVAVAAVRSLVAAVLVFCPAHGGVYRLCGLVGSGGHLVRDGQVARHRVVMMARRHTFGDLHHMIAARSIPPG